MNSEANGDRTVGKAFDVLGMVATAGHPVRFTELLNQRRYPKATLYRFLQNLTNQGMLAYDPAQQSYSLGVRLARLAHVAWSQSSLAPLARPWLDKLAAEVGETVHLAQLDQGQVLYVDKRNAAKPLDMFSQAGKVGPAYCTGVGKAMLAFLPEAELQRASAPVLSPLHARTLGSPEELTEELAAIRARGRAYDREEHEPVIICVALPILTRAGTVLGALSVTSTTARTSLAKLSALAPRIAEIATGIAGEGESWRFSEQTIQV